MLLGSRVLDWPALCFCGATLSQSGTLVWRGLSKSGAFRSPARQAADLTGSSGGVGFTQAYHLLSGDSRKLTSLNWIIHLEWIRVGQMGVPFNSVFTRLMKLVQPAEGPNVSQTCMLPFTYSRRKQASPAHPRVTNTLAIVCSDISPHSA